MAAGAQSVVTTRTLVATVGTIIGISLSRDKRNPRPSQRLCGLRDLAMILQITVKRRVDHIPSPRRVWSSANAHAKEAAMKRMAFMLGMTLAVGMTLGVLGNRLLNAGHAPVNISELLKT